ncbi:MAG: asparagine synthase-related protein [Acidimicrobiia bacterium]
MIVHIDSTATVVGEIPSSLARYISEPSGGVRIVGDRTSSKDVYLWSDGSSAAVSTDMAALIEDRRRAGHAMPISEFGTSALLYSGLVPLPFTVYESVNRLSSGDVVQISSRNDHLDLSYDVDYPWLESRSTGDRVSDESTLLTLLTAATERQLAEVGNRGFLMLSSGKDSPAIALALAEAGLTDIECVTYRSHEDDLEAPMAADICKRLGLSHSIVDPPSDPETVSAQLTQFFERAPAPGVDLAQIPYVAATMSVNDPHGAVLDGGGNDSFMNHEPSAHSRRRLRLRVPSPQVARVMRKTMHVESRFNYAARSRQEMGFAGRLPRQRHLDRLLAQPADIESWWEAQSRETASMEVADEFDLVLRRQIHAAQVLLKQKLASTAIGLDALLPWCDDDVADYYFNLPRVDRFDIDGRSDKLLLKKMLAKYLDYDADAVGKRYFLFDGASFIQSNIEFVRAEVEASPLWEASGQKLIDGWLTALPRRPMLHHALLTVFMMSGWSNHYLPAVEALRQR